LRRDAARVTTQTRADADRAGAAGDLHLR
jgi:hypothetical protein